MVPRSVGNRDGGTRVLQGIVDRITSQSECVFDIDVFLGYKKDTFLELSLVSNNFPLSPNKPTTIPTINTTALFLIAPCAPTACNSNNCSNPLILLALIPGLLALLLEVLLVLYLWTPLGVCLEQYRREVR